MTTSNINYNAVLADLEARKAQIESAIAAVKNIVASSGGGHDGSSEGVISPENIPVGAFLRLSIADATKKFLDMVKTKQSIPQIVQALERGGLPRPKNNTVYSVLRRRESGIGDIIRVGDEWALGEWYPNNPNLRKRTPEAVTKKKAKKKTGKKKVARASVVASTTPTITILDGAEKILMEMGRELHAKAIADRLNTDFGKNTTAASVAGSLVQDSKGRFKNLGDNIWDLVERPEK